MESPACAGFFLEMDHIKLDDVKPEAICEAEDIGSTEEKRNTHAP